MSTSDTTSVSLLEAMACGVFPIVSDILVNWEWIDDGVNGFVVSARDDAALARAIIEAWENGEMRAAAAARNQTIIDSRAEWKQNMAAVGELFGRLVDA